MPSGIAGTVIDVQVFTREGIERDKRAQSIIDDMLKGYKQDLASTFPVTAQGHRPDLSLIADVLAEAPILYPRAWRGEFSDRSLTLGLAEIDLDEKGAEFLWAASHLPDFLFHCRPIGIGHGQGRWRKKACDG